MHHEIFKKQIQKFSSQNSNSIFTFFLIKFYPFFKFFYTQSPSLILNLLLLYHTLYYYHFITLSPTLNTHTLSIASLYSHFNLISSLNTQFCKPLIPNSNLLFLFVLSFLHGHINLAFN